MSDYEGAQRYRSDKRSLTKICKVISPPCPEAWEGSELIFNLRRARVKFALCPATLVIQLFSPPREVKLCLEEIVSSEVQCS